MSFSSFPYVFVLALCLSMSSGTVLFSFETGIDGWFGGTPNTYSDSSAQAGVYQNSAHATLGSYSLRVAFDHQSGKQKAVFLVENLNLDLSSYASLSFDLWKSGQPPAVTVALSTGAGWQWHESSTKYIIDGSNTVTVSLLSSDWKTEASGWANTVSIANRNAVKRIAIIFIPTTYGFNEAFIDNVRVNLPSTTATSTTSTTKSATATTSTTKAPTTTTTTSTTSTTKAPTTTTTTTTTSTTKAPTTTTTTSTTKAPSTTTVTTTSTTKISTTTTSTTKAPTTTTTTTTKSSTSTTTTKTSTSTTTGASSTTGSPATGFVARSGTKFVVNGCPYYFAGTNCYYLIYKSQSMVDSVLDAAVSMGLKVIRMWAMIDIGSIYPDNSRWSIDGMKEGVFFQYWDTAANKPAYNNGTNGLQRLDYVLAAARTRGLRLVLTLVNNWSQFGGMDQYVIWYQQQYHDDFYSHPQIRQAYKNYAAYLINRVNTVNGIMYKNDPTIFAWQLTNELRCKGSGSFGVSSSCSPSKLVAWVSEMSAYIKSLDPNHMVSVGDEGFMNQPGNSDWTYNGNEGADYAAFIALSNVDYGTFHIYTQDWGRDVSWGQTWISNHINAAHSIGKPAVLEEYGWKGSGKASNLQAFINSAQSLNIAGTNYWMLAAQQDGGGLYPDFDSYTIYNDNGADASVIKTHASYQNAKNSCY